MIRIKDRHRNRGRPVKIYNAGYGDTGADIKGGDMKTWRPFRASPQEDIDRFLGLLRGRSADLSMGGSSIAAGALSNARQNIVGSGLHVAPRPKYKILGMTPEEADEWAYLVREGFDLWAQSVLCDTYRRNNFYDLQDIALASYLVDGDSFVLIKQAKASAMMPFSLRLQVLEAARVCNPGTGSATPQVYGYNPDTGNRIVSGIEIDGNGAIVAYWVASKYPNDHLDTMEQTTWQRVTAFGKRTGRPNILQIAHDTRANQYRGVPYLANAIATMKQIDRYTRAELVTAIIKSYFTLFFTQSAAHDNAFPLRDGSGDGMTDEDRMEQLKKADIRIGPGTLNALPPNWDIKEVDAAKNLSTFEPFTTQLMKQVGAAIGQPYEVLLKTFNSSYSASRAALMQAWANFKTMRTWFAADFCQPVYEMWLSEAVARGYIKAPGFFESPILRAAWSGCDWYGPVMGTLDPVKEIQAAGKRIEWGMSTREKECAEITGTSFAENMARLQVENRQLKEAGMPLYPDNTISQGANNGNPAGGAAPSKEEP